MVAQTYIESDAMRSNQHLFCPPELLSFRSKRRAEQRSAFRLGLWPGRALLTGLFPPLGVRAVRRSVAVHRCRRSTRPDTARDERTDETTSALNPPGALRDHVSREVAIIADRVLPVPPLPNAAFATAGHDR
jgi:hypothetical protein